jgi:hypothetical protein
LFVCLVQDGVNVAGISPIIMCFNVRLELVTKIAIGGGMALDSHDMGEKHRFEECLDMGNGFQRLVRGSSSQPICNWGDNSLKAPRRKKRRQIRSGETLCSL